VTTLSTAWTKVRDKAKVVGRWHANRHTLVTELSESGAGDEVIMSIAGHVSRAMLSRYSHVRMEAKRRALDEIAARQRAADEQRRGDAERREQDAVLSQSAVRKRRTIADVPPASRVRLRPSPCPGGNAPDRGNDPRHMFPSGP
jgi:hypothetical protein